MKQMCSVWAQMCFKPANSRSLAMKRGELVDKFYFCVGENSIPSFEKPVKSLGKTYNCSTRYTAPVQCSIRELESTREIQSMDLPAWHPATRSQFPQSTRLQDNRDVAAACMNEMGSMCWTRRSQLWLVNIQRFNFLLSPSNPICWGRWTTYSAAT